MTPNQRWKMLGITPAADAKRAVERGPVRLLLGPGDVGQLFGRCGPGVRTELCPAPDGCGGWTDGAAAQYAVGETIAAYDAGLLALDLRPEFRKELLERRTKQRWANSVYWGMMQTRLRRMRNAPPPGLLVCGLAPMPGGGEWCHAPVSRWHEPSPGHAALIWLRRRLAYTGGDADRLPAAEIWRAMCAELGAPADADVVAGVHRKGLLRLARAALGETIQSRVMYLGPGLRGAPRKASCWVGVRWQGCLDRDAKRPAVDRTAGRTQGELRP